MGDFQKVRRRERSTRQARQSREMQGTGWLLLLPSSSTPYANEMKSLFSLELRLGDAS